jgi:(S)-ureidoglycine aminohydrolase
MKKTIFLIIHLAPLFVVAQIDSLISKVYEWKQPAVKMHNKIGSAVLFEGSGGDMQWIQMNSVEFGTSEASNKFTVPANEEQLYIVKNGTLTVGVNDSLYSLARGSIILLLPRQSFSMQNKGAGPCDYYVMKYRSRSPTDLQRGKDSGGSFVMDWNNIVFKPNEKGGGRSYFERPTAMCKRMEMHVTTLNAGLKSHAAHTHHAAEMIVVIDGKTEMQIGQRSYQGKKGDVYYLGSYVLHGIRNIGTESCTYFAIQFE